MPACMSAGLAKVLPELLVDLTVTVSHDLALSRYQDPSPCAKGSAHGVISICLHVAADLSLEPSWLGDSETDQYISQLTAKGQAFVLQDSCSRLNISRVLMRPATMPGIMGCPHSNSFTLAQAPATASPPSAAALGPTLMVPICLIHVESKSAVSVTSQLRDVLDDPKTELQTSGRQDTGVCVCVSQ